MKRFTVVAVLALLAACGKSAPANQAAQDIKAMGAQRDKAKDAVKAMEESQEKTRQAASDDSEKN